MAFGSKPRGYSAQKRKRVSMPAWQPYEWQIQPYKDTSRVMLLWGSAGGGKSTLAAQKCHRLALSFPGSFILIMRKTRESITSSTALFLQHSVVGTSAQHVISNSQFRYPNGSIIQYAGMSTPKERQRIRSIGSAGGVDVIWMEEGSEFALQDYEELSTRLRGTAMPFRQIIISTNADHSGHWINQKLILGGEASSYRSSAADNPAHPPDYHETMENLTGVLYERLTKGIWTSADGQVFSEWSPERNLIDSDSVNIRGEWPRYGSIDFGYENPAVIQWWAVDPETGIMYMYREAYHRHLLATDMAEIIHECSKGEEIRWYADHDAGERALLRKEGIITKPADKEVLRGIHSVNDRLRNGKIKIVRGSLLSVDPKLREAHLPTCTADEVPAYVWAQNVQSDIPKDEPKKEHDHGCDAMRYAVRAVDRGRMRMV